LIYPYILLIFATNKIQFHRMKKKYLSILLASATTIFFVGCNNEEPQETIEETPVEVVEEEREELILPSTIHLVSLFENAGIKYQDGVANTVDNASKYATKNSKLLNLGIYSADLSYGLLSDQFDLARAYFKQISDLANQTGMSEIYDPALYTKRFEKNMGSRDSIVEMMNEIQQKTELYVYENDQPDLVIITFAGAWIEANYLAHKVRNAQNEKEINARFMEQMSFAKTLLIGLKQIQDPTQEITDLIAGVESIISTFNSLDVIKNRPAKTPYDQLNITNADVDALAKTLVDLRSKIIQA